MCGIRRDRKDMTAYNGTMKMIRTIYLCRREESIGSSHLCDFILGTTVSANHPETPYESKSKQSIRLLVFWLCQAFKIFRDPRL